MRASFIGVYDIGVTQYKVTLDGFTVYSNSADNPYYLETLSDTDQLPHFQTPVEKLSDFMGASAREVQMNQADCCLKIDATLQYEGSWYGRNDAYHPETGTYHEVFYGGPGSQGSVLVEALFEVSLKKQ